MKSGICKFSALALAVILTMSFDSPVTLDKEYTKVIIKEFPLSEHQMVEINNQYGLVKVEAWDQNAVKIKIEIVVDTDSESSAQEIYKRIKFGFEESGKGVSCTTNVESNDSGFWNWWGNSCSSEYSINFDVKMPAASHLVLSNKYGDCTVNQLSRSADYRIKYGNLYQSGEMSEISLSMGYGKAKIDGADLFNGVLEYGNLKLGHAESCELNSKYSNVIIQEVGELICNTKYDDYHIEQITTLRNSGKYDDFHIESISDISMNTMYADLEIGRLHHFADLKFKYGEVEIAELMQNFRKINMEGSYADFVVNTSQVSSFQVDVDGNYSQVKCDRRLSGVEERKEGTSYRLTGHVSESHTGGDIIARVTYGSVRIK